MQVIEKTVNNIKELKKEATREYIDNPKVTILVYSGKEIPGEKTDLVSLNATIWKGLDAVTMIKDSEGVVNFQIPEIPEGIVIFKF